ncbi:hypothetical protein K474DRAFT_1678993 [Panus rudis PR-1116 ss-1]|nr:hypothetical protein K474DRAFT_1678993 [Panus rudis PR-1116 ss-1]
MRGMPRAPLRSTLLHLSSEMNNSRFRLLVIGKPGCGKSSLVKSVFGVELGPANKDHHVLYGDELCSDNVRLKYLEHSLLGDEARLHYFIKHRIDSRYPLEERLTSICGSRICLTANDNGAGLAEIVDLCKGQVPIVIVFTKFDEVMLQVLLNMSNDSLEDLSDYDTQFEHAKERSWRQLDQVVHRIFGDCGLPIAYTSKGARYAYSIRDLVQKTDQWVQDWSEVHHRTLFPILEWSLAQRISDAIKLEQLIQVGQARYWRCFLQPFLKNRPMSQLINALHAENVQVWNMHDPDGLLFGEKLKDTLSQLVRDSPETLASDDSVLRSPIRAEWVNETYQATEIQMYRVMTYIVNTSAILNKLFQIKTINRVTEADITQVVDKFVDSGRREEIRQAVYQFTLPTESSQGLLIYDELRRLVCQFCDPPEIDEAFNFWVAWVMQGEGESRSGGNIYLPRPQTCLPSNSRTSLRELCTQVLSGGAEAAPAASMPAQCPKWSANNCWACSTNAGLV